MAGGHGLDRERRLSFTFDGRSFSGFAGDTLASALMANGVRRVGRSFKYHRPRGILSAGPEEPNAILRVGAGSRAEPNSRATVVELHQGLVAESQNRFPSLDFDLGAANSLIARFLPSGFYYKTFMGPQFAGQNRAWMIYERFIRAAAGMGKPVRHADPDVYEHRTVHCDVLVVGGGPAGLAAAHAAADAGADVIIVDERPALGGQLCFETYEIDGLPAPDFARRSAADLAGRPNVAILTRTTAFGFYDHGTVALAERVTDHLGAVAPASLPRQRRWQVKARRIVLAQGAIERPLVFADNDLPGVMQASAVRRYANQFAAAAGKQVLVATANDDGYRTALDLAAKDVRIALIADARPTPGPIADLARLADIRVVTGYVPTQAIGRGEVQGCAIAPTGGGKGWIVGCDAIAVSGGFTPSVHLHSQAGGKLIWRDDIGGFVPGLIGQAAVSAGAANGTFGLAAIVKEAAMAGADAAEACGFARRALPEWAVKEDDAAPAQPLWVVALPEGLKAKRFVDFQNDVTADDLGLAVRENYRSVEHVKRYTTLGMGTDQGKTSNLNGLAIVAEKRGTTIAEAGTTTFRPPYTPVTLGALVGAETGKHHAPVRRTPLDAWHRTHGAVMTSAGLWERPKTYIRPGETYREAWIRETLAVRSGVGLCDVSTLGKIDVQGPDAQVFLDRLYCNPMASLAIGKARYGLMLRDDGMVFDDGTVTRVGDTRFYLTTTTANAGKVLSHMEFLLATAWTDLKVQVASISDHFGQIAVAGPRSRAVLETAAGISLGDDVLPHLGTLALELAGHRCRLFRVSYSGERAYEVSVPWRATAEVWNRLMTAGSADGIVPYGLEAMGAMRIEKGHVAGAELDGRTTPADLGLGRMVSTKKAFVGKVLLGREGLRDPDRLKLVGLEPIDGATSIPAGANLVRDPAAPTPMPILGHVTSATHSPTLGRPIALALIKPSAVAEGKELFAAAPLLDLSIAVKVCDPVFVDAGGGRMHG
ncbi:sarcosine oxidase subunit alpha family protein [Phreatobacter stygius]|uniref:Sarcosine oxidase subunit alpha family protein n=1 Tax=Phreatobacter stygius TaxID=1940610 RepID=A0A4D7BGM8_9HYPH|nr:sarcosine oxidase subunit alpha family protein [Phreatobacter stygius]